MKVWKGKDRGRGVWSSEIRLKTVDFKRQKKVDKLLKLLKEDMVENIY